MNEDDNIIGSVERSGIRFTRKFITNYKEPTVRLYYTKVIPEAINKINPIANLCIVHGFSHYSGEFYEFANFLAKNGVICHLIDLRGHGYSGGIRLDWTTSELQSDILTLLKEALNEDEELPTYVFGHSMGGGLVASLFVNNENLQVNGVILSAPLLGIPLNVDQNGYALDVFKCFGDGLRVRKYFDNFRSL